MSDRVNKIVKKCFDYILPIAISAALVVWLLHKVKFSRIEEVIREGVEFRWILLMVLVLIISHVIRGIRWGIQLRGAGVPRLSVMTESVSIFGAYALNMVFSYLGEAWRCLYISRLTGAKITTVVGTDLGDRASDAIVVILLVILALFVATPAMDSFLDHYRIAQTIDIALKSKELWIWAAAIFFAIVAVCWVFRNSAPFARIKNGFLRIWKGFAVMFHMKGMGWYLVLTAGIWICYFLETYICFQAFPFTRQLVSAPGLAWGLIPGLVVFVFGSCSIAIPSSGGLGPWNIAVMFALSLYGIPQDEGAAYSLVVWSFQAGALVLLGLFSAIYIGMQKRLRDNSDKPQQRPCENGRQNAVQD